MADDLFLTLGGRVISGWDEISVTRSIERLPSEFSLSLMDYYPGNNEKQLVNPGELCTVRLGDDLVMTGNIDRWNPVISKSRHEIRVSGRGRCRELVDCSAEWPNNVISQSTALQIAQKLAAPYGITVASDIEDMEIVPQFTLNWGESTQEVLSRVCRWAAMLFYDLPDGSLYMTRVGDRNAASGIAQGENIEDASFTSSMDERYSDYIGVSMSTNALYSDEGGYSSVTLATAHDQQVADLGYRNRVVVVESTMNINRLAQSCIDWEMNRRYGRSKQLQVTIDSWRDKAGNLWEPNTLIPIRIPAFGIDEALWLLSEVTFIRDRDGTRARMILMPPEAFFVQPYSFYSQFPVLRQ